MRAVATFTFIGAPADSVLRGGGAERAPARLRELGLVDALGADAGDLPVRIRGDARDPRTGIIASADVLATTRAVRDGVVECIARGGRPFVSGGCCAVMPGAVAGARDVLGRVGLVYVDGHQDMYDGRTSTSGEAADMPLGVAIGIGPTDWVDAAGGVAVSASDTFLLGPRDFTEIQESDAAPADSYGVAFSPLTVVRERGPSDLGASVAASLEAGPGGYWLHLDVDVLDSELFPATDYLQPDGLSFAELGALLEPFMGERLIGFSLGCFNPDKDADGQAGALLAEMLKGLLGNGR